jgi:hypothetical protein
MTTTPPATRALPVADQTEPTPPDWTARDAAGANDGGGPA